jgi:hypothetical protein
MENSQKLLREFNEAVASEALLVYALPYQSLPKQSQCAIRERVKNYFMDRIEEMTEEIS